MSSIKNFKLTDNLMKYGLALNDFFIKNSHNIFVILTITFVIVFIFILCSFLCLLFHFRSMYLKFSKLSKVRFEAFELKNFRTEDVEATSESSTKLKSS